MTDPLADLAAVKGSSVYLCGTGGLRYLETEPFTAQDVTVLPFHTPAAFHDIWQSARQVSALWALATIGANLVADELRAMVSRA